MTYETSGEIRDGTSKKVPVLRVLTCVFSCCPPETPGFSGGEDVLGWQLLKQIGLHHDVWALTRQENRECIESAPTGETSPNIHFQYVGLPGWLRPFLRFQGTHQFYAYLWQIAAYFTARKLHRQHKFDLFHHITYANDWMPSFVGALLPVSYIRGPGGGAHKTPKGLEREYPPGGQVWERVRSLSQWLFRRDPFFRRGQDRADALLLCNKESISQVPSKWSKKVHEFPVNGISSEDLEINHPDQRSGNATDIEFQILTAGSLIRVKGFGLAIKAFDKFRQRHPDSSFTIVGSGPEESRLRGLISKMHLEGKVDILEAMPRDQLLRKMASCDVFLFPSLRDGGGAVVIEAMAVGKPVVCLDTGGPAMHVTVDCGVKVSPASSEVSATKLADALETLYLDRNLRERLGATAAKRAEEFYHWDRLGDRLMCIYRQVTTASVIK
jgi:glycosyltransferase involved in cell wall biosynthesis